MKRPSGEHSRRYNRQRSDEVDILMPNDATNNRDIVLHYRDGGLKHISELYNKIYLGKFGRLTLCGNNAANKLVDLTLYPKGWVEASHRDLITSKAGHLKSKIIFAKRCLSLLSTPSYRCCRNGWGCGNSSNWTLPFYLSIRNARLSLLLLRL